MRKEARLFKNKAVDALVLAIETFNGPTTAVALTVSCAISAMPSRC
jgi:hypothetical protein